MNTIYYALMSACYIGAVICILRLMRLTDEADE